MIKPADASDASLIVYLTVNSIQGNPNPQTGSYFYNKGDRIISSIDSPVILDDTEWECVGYTGTGSTPTGEGTTLSFWIFENSTITWNWQEKTTTTNNQTINADNNNVAAKTPKTSSATEQTTTNPPIQLTPEQTVKPTTEQSINNPPDVQSTTEQTVSNSPDVQSVTKQTTSNSSNLQSTTKQIINDIPDEQPVIEQTTSNPSTLQSTTKQTINNPKTLRGLSGYPTNTNQVANIIAVMQENNLNLYRMSFNPTWMSGPHPYHPEYIQYFLDHTPSDWVIIVDRNHIYPPTEEGAAAFRTNIDVARNSILAVCGAWPNNPRVWVEMGNEYVSTDFHVIFQGLIDDVRNAGYTNTLVVDKWNTAWSTAVFSDPYDSVYVGMHFYFNTWSVSGAISQMNTALSLGLKLVNTEVGADFNEANKFTKSTVDEVTNFLLQCTELGVGNTVWMNENLANWQRYQQLDLTFP